MTLLSPFFTPRPAPRSNFGGMLKEVAQRLDDEQLVEWSNQIDWQEPVVSLQRIERSQYQRDEAITSIHSPLEILVLSGDMRLIKLLLTRERVEAPPLFFSGGAFGRDSYHDVHISMGLINSAIKTGSLDIVKHVSKMALEHAPHSSFQWNNSSGVYTPIVCLADQRHFSADLSWSMWECLEKLAVDTALGAGFAGREFASNIKSNLRNTLFSEAARLGNSSLADKLAKKLKTKISFSQWKNILYEGDFAWACNFVAREVVWGKNRADRDASNSAPEALLSTLCAALAQQRQDIQSTFKGHERKNECIRVNNNNFAMLMDTLSGALGGKSLLSIDACAISSQAGATLVGWSASRASRFLSSIDAPMSVNEAVAWMEKIVAQPPSAARLIERLNGCTPLEYPSSQWVDIVGDNIQNWAKQNGSVVLPVLFPLSESLGVKDLPSALRAQFSASSSVCELASDLQAKAINDVVPVARHHQPFRRI